MRPAGRIRSAGLFVYLVAGAVPCIEHVRFMSEARPLFPKQFIILVVLFVGVFVLSRVAINWEDDDDEVAAYLAIAQNLPEIPKLSNWPEAYYDALRAAYSGVGDFEDGFLTSFQEIGCLYLENGFLSEARSVFSVLLSLDATNELWLYCYAKSWGELFNGDRLETLEALVSGSDRYLKAHSLFLEALCAVGRQDDALFVAMNAVERWPNRVETSYDLANVLFSYCRSGDALELVDELEASGRALPRYVDELIDVYGGAMVVDSNVGECAEKPSSVAQLSRLNQSDPFESYLESFRYAYADLSELVERKVQLGRVEEAESALERLRLLYPEDAARGMN